MPAQPRRYERKVKNAQEAHEAIRPAGDRFRTPEQVSGRLTGDEYRLYDLIWKRTVASQMADAVGNTVSARLGARASVRNSAFAPTLPDVVSFMLLTLRIRCGGLTTGRGAESPPGLYLLHWSAQLQLMTVRVGEVDGLGRHP